MAAVAGGDTRKRKKQHVKPRKNPDWTELRGFLKLSEKEKSKKIVDGFRKSDGKKGYCVASGITLEQFESKCKALEKSGNANSFRWEFIEGKAWIYEFPTSPHEAAGGHVIQTVILALGQHRVLGFDTSSSPLCRHPHIAGGMEPDSTIGCDLAGRPGPGNAGRSDDRGNRWPNLIIETAFNESVTHAHERAIRWLSEGNHPTWGVKQVIVINIGALRHGPLTNGTHSMTAWRYEQKWNAQLANTFATFNAVANPGATPVAASMAIIGLSKAVNEVNNPVQTFEFGIPNRGNGTGVTAFGQMVLQVPMAGLFHPSAVPAGLPAVVDVDLYPVRHAIQRKL